MNRRFVLSISALVITLVALLTPLSTAHAGPPRKWRCSALAEHGWTAPSSVEKIFNRLTKVSTYPPQLGYVIDKDLPQLKDALLIYVNHKAHSLIWYKGRRIDSTGLVGIDIRPFVEETRALEKGLVIALHNLPKDFDARFEDFVTNFDPTHAFTCAQSACRSLNLMLRESGVNPRSLTSSGLIRFFAKMNREDRERLGVEFVNLGVEFDPFMRQIREVEIDNIMASGTSAALASGVSAIPISILLLIGNHLL